MITQNFDINMIPDSAPVVVHCDQYDHGTGRLVASLYENDIPYTPTDASATVQGEKPDGKGFAYNATISGNVVTADLTEQMSAVAGSTLCQFVITESTGRTGTFIFILEVQRSALPSDTDISESDYQIIQEAVETVNQAVDTAAGYAQNASDSADEAADYVDDAEAWARGTRDGVDVPSTDETYENNAKYYAEKASELVDSAGFYKLYGSTSTIIAAGEDLNNYTTIGTYIKIAGNTTISNSPNDLTSRDKFLLIVQRAYPFRDAPTPPPIVDSNLMQIMYVYRSGTSSTQTEAWKVDIYVRAAILNGYGWGAWKKVTADFSELPDVNINNPTDGQAVVYDADSGEWVNGDVAVSDMTDLVKGIGRPDGITATVDDGVFSAKGVGIVADVNTSGTAYSSDWLYYTGTTDIIAPSASQMYRVTVTGTASLYYWNGTRYVQLASSGGGGGANLIDITLDDYNALTDDEKNDPNVWYWINDTDSVTTSALVIGSLAGLSDINLSSPSNGDVLFRDGQEWSNKKMFRLFGGEVALRQTVTFSAFQTENYGDYKQLWIYFSIPSGWEILNIYDIQITAGNIIPIGWGHTDNGIVAYAINLENRAKNVSSVYVYGTFMRAGVRDSYYDITT